MSFFIFSSANCFMFSVKLYVLLTDDDDASSWLISGGDNSLAVVWCECPTPPPPPYHILDATSASSSAPVYQRLPDDDGLFDLDKLRGSVRTFFLLLVNNTNTLFYWKRATCGCATMQLWLWHSGLGSWAAINRLWAQLPASMLSDAILGNLFMHMHLCH